MRTPRFLNNFDYDGIITEESLNQLTRGKESRILQAEEAAEASMIEYLTDHYKIEEEIWKGKSIMDYNRQITYPVGSHFYYQDKIYQAIQTINSHKRPASVVYWEESDIADLQLNVEYQEYSQLENYYPNDIVVFQNTYYTCRSCNGPDFLNVRVPGIIAWEEVETQLWEPNVDYMLWDVVLHDGNYYCLISEEGLDETVNPYDSDNWGMIAEYDPEYNSYEFSDHEYVVYERKVFKPAMQVNSDELVQNVNIIERDPRNKNIKKHMARLALYELFKLISPNNISTVRVTDYTMSIQWLRDASKMRINPQIPRKLDERNRPVTDWQIATFKRKFDPYENSWLT